MAEQAREQQPDSAAPDHSGASARAQTQQDAVPSNETETTPGVRKETEQQAQDKINEQHEQKHDGPAGGFDDTPIPSPPPGTVGYTLKIIIHRATDLAMGDAHTFSSDPYVLAQMNTGLPVRHKEDPRLRFRTPTVHRSIEPEWNEEWIVANVPSSGFKLKLRVYDEDPADHDDLLGKVHITVPRIDDDWKGFDNEPYQVTLRDSSKRAVMVRAVARALKIVHHMRGEVYVSIKNLGRTGEDGQNGRAYTVGPCRWIQHYSPILGRIAKIKEPEPDDEAGQSKADAKAQKKAEKYNFQANQMQLPGPVPAQLYHRFVEFKPWVQRMFNTKGIQGIILGKALHHQHTRVYDFGRATVWGHLPEGPSIEQTKKFLDLVHYDIGGRIFTYVLNLDALWRFTETGKEFGIDMLSKHTMHSDVSIYIAFSGEFFIRRLKHKHHPPPPQPTEGTSQQPGPDRPDNETHPPHDLAGGPPDEDPPKDPANYELVIDNDSGTYRPNAALLPVLSEYLARCLPGLHIQTLDCQADADKMEKMKEQQRERKKTEGDHIIYAQVSDSSSMSSSDEERLDDVQKAYHGGQLPKHHQDVSTGDGAEREHGTLAALAKDMKLQQGARIEKFGRNSMRKPRGEDGDGT